MADPLDRQKAIFYGSFVSAAYAMFEASDTNLRPDPKDVPNGWNVVAWITMNDFFLGREFEKFYGILAESEQDPSEYVLAIRGTQEAIEWYNNTFAFLVPFDRVPGSGYVHDGFMRIYDTMKVTPRPQPTAGKTLEATAAAVPPQPSGSFADQVAAVVQQRATARAGGAELAEAFPAGARIVVVAHSLGAALATLYVVENMKKHAIPNPLVCTFASPRVGDQTFVSTFNGLGLTSWRIVNAPDLVPNVPPDIWGYRHVDALTLVNSTGQVQPTLPCAHAMSTYDHMLDPAKPVDPGCTVTAEEAQRLLDPIPELAIQEQIDAATSGVRAGDA
jgi:hypothetical protein